MENHLSQLTAAQLKPWPAWQRIIFRFAFIYFSLVLLSFPYFENKPFLKWAATAQYKVMTFFVVPAGEMFGYTIDEWQLKSSNDTAFRLVVISITLVIATLGTIVWGIADKHRKSYYRLNYYLSTALRYFIVFMSLLYGSIKLFPFQMPLPLLTDQAIPLGDFSPILLTWRQLGYSPGYQIFLGAAEVAAALLLLYKRTYVLGLFIGLGVYLNVMMLNFFYDIPVKIFSTHIVLGCIYLLLPDLKRILNFFIFNKTAEPSNRYHYKPSGKWPVYFRYTFKMLFIIAFIGIFIDRATVYFRNDDSTGPIAAGVYDVEIFVKNGDTLPVLANDREVWKDVIFEKTSNMMSVGTSDMAFKRYLGRGIAYYKPNTSKALLYCFKDSKNKLKAPTLQYEIKDSTRVVLKTIIRNDTITAHLLKRERKFFLEKRPFHWVREK